MPAKPSIWEYLPQPERDCIPPRDRQVWPGYWIYHNRDDSISFGTEQRDYFGRLPAEITRAVPESLINTIASMVCHAHRMGRKEAYNFLKQFVLEQMREELDRFNDRGFNLTISEAWQALCTKSGCSCGWLRRSRGQQAHSLDKPARGGTEMVSMISRLPQRAVSGLAEFRAA
jgi:hypothetical protein